MSQQPPPPPYGGPPMPSGQPPSGMSNKAKFWIGVALAVPAVIVGPVLTGLAFGAGDAIASGSALGGLLGGLVSLLILGGLVTAIVLEKTRWFALGMLAGLAILVILAAGACVVLIVALTNSYGVAP